MFPQHFIIEGKFYGTAQRKWDKQDRLPQPPISYAFFCPVCAELWARCPVEAWGKTQRFEVITRACRKHPHPLHLGIPGSLDLSWDVAFGEAVMDAAVGWEFQRAIEQYPETETNNESNE